ncbi:hypothetical protein ATANTOWER_031041 [Ataeniobius toweri]|uniref:Uncharacterized protein n=1 Tax=Ataeniobius toweri TaxID=208326 RepID=A0ABU7AS43_9TELE|nr:hypothetical protein [Ataeniobius toweri]
MKMCWSVFSHPFPVRHSEGKRTSKEEEDGGTGEEDKQWLVLMKVLSNHDNSCVCVQTPERFSQDASQYNNQLTFEEMNLSRPILKVRPSPVRSKESRGTRNTVRTVPYRQTLPIISTDSQPVSQNRPSQ